VNLPHALTGSWYASLTRCERVIVHILPQVALNMVKNSESQVREMARRRDHQQLFDMMAVLLEEVRKRAQLIASEASQPREQLLQVSLAWPYCVDEEFNAWQTQVLEVEGQGVVPKVASSPRSKPADRECLKTLFWSSLTVR
jgi:hypothetical protein